jgi:hypothetical protein
MARLEPGGKPTITDDGLLLIPTGIGGLVCALGSCKTPDCPCRHVTAETIKLADGTTEVMRKEAGLVIGRAADADPPPAPFDQSWSLKIEIDTGALVGPDGSVIDLPSYPDLTPLAEALDTAMLDRLARMWLQHKRQRIVEGSVRPDLDLRSWISGDKLAWAEVFSTVRADGYHYRGIDYFAVDYYCVMPDCDCDDVDIAFAGEELAGEVRVGLESGEVEQVPASGKAGVLPALWDRFVKRHHGIDILRQRYAAMKRFGREYITSVSEQRQDEPVKAKVGRNQPCPCGSGKKYKRCCLGK